MSPDWWWGALVGVIASIALLVTFTVIAAFVLMRSAELAEPRTWTGYDDPDADDYDGFLRDLNRQGGTHD